MHLCSNEKMVWEGAESSGRPGPRSACTVAQSDVSAPTLVSSYAAATWTSVDLLGEGE